jgi:AcrR family transcriptional regulator
LILTATTQIFLKERVKAANANYVAKKSGVSIGTLYQYFKDKEYKNHGLPQFENQHYHRLAVEWKHTVPLAKAIPAQMIKEYRLYHPIPAQQRILNDTGLEKLISELKKIS